MKAIYLVRKVDLNGRIVVPKQFREMIRVSLHDELEMLVEMDCIILKKYERSCLFCGDNHKIISYKGKHVCAICAAEISGIHE